MIRVNAWGYDATTDKYMFRLVPTYTSLGMEDRSIPILFSICRETRQIAQRTFIRGITNIRNSEKLYWNSDVDFFYLNLRTLRVRNPYYPRLRTLHDSFLLVQNLGLWMGPTLWHGLIKGTCVEWLHGFPNLKHLRLVVELRNGCGPWHWMKSLTYDLSGHLSIPEEFTILPAQAAATTVSTDEQNCPTYVQEAVAQKFEQYRADNHPEWVPPVVEVYQLSDC
jgi:hypothetical protein